MSIVLVLSTSVDKCNSTRSVLVLFAFTDFNKQVSRNVAMFERKKPNHHLFTPKIFPKKSFPTTLF